MKADITLNDLYLLAVLRRGNTHGYDLGRSLDMSIASVYRTLKRLTYNGCVVQVPSDHHDQRRKRYSITKMGDDLLCSSVANLIDMGNIDVGELA